MLYEWGDNEDAETLQKHRRQCLRPEAREWSTYQHRFSYTWSASRASQDTSKGNHVLYDQAFCLAEVSLLCKQRQAQKKKKIAISRMA